MDYHFFHQRSFSAELQTEFADFVQKQQTRFPANEILRMDLHCHDYNSDVPDEILGRIMKVPETWTPTETVIQTLKQNGCDAFTITNHNNARSCYAMQDKGFDLLTAAEFSCTVSDFNIGIHVLAYGFTPEQEVQLNKKRKNVYAFQEFAVANDIPTVWAHPLYHYSPQHIPDMAFFDKMSLIFSRFEVINGQRDTWQNMLVKSWIEGLTPDYLDERAGIFGINPYNYSEKPYNKFVTGGSDSHMGIFTGLSGTLLHVPDLAERRRHTPTSVLALEAIKNGLTAPYGSHNNHEKLNIAFLDYVCQIALNYQDPGLLRMMLHKGTNQDKMLGLFISNAFLELKRHKTTMRFVELFHQAFSGHKPGKIQRVLVSKDYKPIFDQATHIAQAKISNPHVSDVEYTKALHTIQSQLDSLVWKRTQKKLKKWNPEKNLNDLTLNQIIEKFEIPVTLRSYLPQKESKPKNKSHQTNRVGLWDMLDGLSFPFLASSLLLAAHFTSLKVLYNARPMLDNFSRKLNKYKHPKRMLWLTDTYEDKNGVSMVLQSMVEHIRMHDLPIDLLVCSDMLESAENLIVIKPDAVFTLPFYQQQPIRMPNLSTITKIFQKGEYDRIMTSTELPMGLVALFLKHAYTVPAYFYMHTDWMTFARKNLKLDEQATSRMKRLLRSYYGMFDQIFVLNNDHKKWLSGEQMNINAKKIKLTAHWADPVFTPTKATENKAETNKTRTNTIVYAGRLSKEKGVLEIPDIAESIKKSGITFKLIFAGAGPEEETLKQRLPEATFLGWVDHTRLPDIYSNADILLLPSRFDTFSCVVLEAMSCGLPVVAYKTKGPKDIIQQNKNGFLVKTKEEFAVAAAEYLNAPEHHTKMRASAIKRAGDYNAELIMNKLLTDTGLSSE